MWSLSQGSRTTSIRHVPAMKQYRSTGLLTSASVAASAYVFLSASVGLACRRSDSKDIRADDASAAVASLVPTAAPLRDFDTAAVRAALGMLDASSCALPTADRQPLTIQVDPKGTITHVAVALTASGIPAELGGYDIGCLVTLLTGYKLTQDFRPPERVLTVWVSREVSDAGRVSFPLRWE